MQMTEYVIKALTMLFSTFGGGLLVMFGTMMARCPGAKGSAVSDRQQYDLCGASKTLGRLRLIKFDAGYHPLESLGFRLSREAFLRQDGVRAKFAALHQSAGFLLLFIGRCCKVPIQSSNFGLGTDSAENDHPHPMIAT
jgi:hypothetical protein